MPPTATSTNLRPAFWVLVGLLCLYEALALTQHDGSSTITQIIREHTINRPILPFLAGLVAGHFFWP